MEKFIKSKFFFLLVVLTFLFLPLQSVFASIFSTILGITTAIPSLIIAFVVFVCGLISAVFVGFAGALLEYVISPEFTALSYTNPNGNPVIKMGLSITQGLANMILVLILVYIAIATILRLAGYETKKLLVKFIIVALLVNFTPVLCGLIVDATNIVMNYFAEPLIGTGGISTFLLHIKRIWTIFAEGFSFEVAIDSWAQISIIFKLIAATIFYLLLALILFWFALVFFLRYIAIWILVILSPIAFVCFILPQNNFAGKIWNTWWTQFIQWSIIGITKMFFLYLGINLMINAPNLFLGKMGMAEYGWFDLIMPYTVPLGFLYMGMLMSFQTTALGAGAMTSLAQKGWGWTKQTTWKGMKKTARAIETRPAVIKAQEKIAARLEKIPLVGGPMATGMYKRIYKKEEELKKELEGVPLKLRARRLGKTTEEMVQKLSPRKFRDLLPSDVDFEVFSAASIQQLEEVSQRGSVALRRAIRNTVRANSQRIVAQWKKLIAEGRKKEADELIKKFKFVRSEANYQV